jgi:GntR family galactonate operon transcriptional repressor
MNQDVLYEKLQAHLMEQGLQPGDKIESEISLAQHFGVSRHTMRGVLGAMAQEGILERAPRRGTVIRSFDTRVLSDRIRFHFETARFDIAQFKEARIIVECATLPLVVRRITPTQLATVAECIETMRLYVDEPDKADTYDKNFHLLLFEASGNDVLNAFSGVLTSLFRSVEYRRKYWTRERILKIIEEHRSILENIQRGDIEGSVAAMEQHLGYRKLSIVT